MKQARHPKAKIFHDSGLFAGIKSFSQLEEGIAALPDKNLKGAAFEVFTEACLATQKIYQASEVWPGNCVPTELCNQLNLPVSDMGVDGVLVTTSGESICYQSKFRMRRPSLSWTELSTFYGLAGSKRRNLVFTNCDKISGIAEDRPGSFFVRGSDLDRLTEADFLMIEEWLQNRQPIREKKKPKPHQITALDDILTTLSKHSRATALMACGTGKTLVALWVAEKLESKTVLILLPSLALVRQTLHEWLNETCLNDIEFLCVCSDSTVAEGDDALVVRPSDLNFAVTTTSSDVRRFLDRETKSVHLVFSTYQSSHVVAKAMEGLKPFDFGVFDEAHKTAGRKGLKFSFPLEDSNLPIAKRLFLTATPKHYEVAKKDKFGDSKMVFSMDVPDVYGPIAHRLPFGLAAKKKIITDYKVIVSVVTSDMVNDETLRQGVVLVEGDEIKALHVANQIAVKSAIDKYGVSKVFTFHSRVKAAEAFTSLGSEGVAMHLPDFKCAHIKGKMTTVRREQIMRDFEAAPKAILSNARCLTEGVDVPAVDMVAFLSPKRSLVDIVQATGRAMRRSPGKTIGYILVPLYVEKSKGEEIEEAVLRSNFDEVWNVLQGLKEQDDFLDNTIKKMSIEKGQTGGFDDTRFRERVETLGPEISLELLQNAISASCLEMLGEKWFEFYGQLIAYKKEFGNCDMPARWPQDQKLATWVVAQRVLKRDGLLSKNKVELLNSIGFKWDPRESYWRKLYLELLEYKRRFGDCCVPQAWAENPKLAQWVNGQRVQHTRGKIPRERKALLDKIDFEWSSGRDAWDHHFTELCEFKDKFGHARVKARWPENTELGWWVSKQRRDRRNNQISPERIQKLDVIGFEWDSLMAAKLNQKAAMMSDDQWFEMFEVYRDYFSKYGSNTVKVTDEHTQKLNRWVLLQRQKKKKGQLDESRVKRLNEIGFIWNHRYDAWLAMFNEYKTHVTSTGSTKVTVKDDQSGRLNRWVLTQRQNRKCGNLTPPHIKMLDEIGFLWGSVYDVQWESMYDQFKAYVEHYGTNVIEVKDDETQKLNRWALTQQQVFKLGKLKKSRFKSLNDIEFVWEQNPRKIRAKTPSGESDIHAKNLSWDEMMRRLGSFYELHGHCNVPENSASHSDLANWVVTQRVNKKRNKLSLKQLDCLNDVGFSWDRHDAAWDAMFVKLAASMRPMNNGKPRVVTISAELQRWMLTQRQAKKKNRLRPDREQRLDSIGFKWEPFADKWEHAYSRLKAYNIAHGNCNVPHQWENDPQLASWVNTQRIRKSKHMLTAHRVDLLEKLGFEWKPKRRKSRLEGKRKNDSNNNVALSNEAAWDSKYQELREYKNTHGDCLVPRRWSENKHLAYWVIKQRMAFNRSELELSRVELLNKLEFAWNAIEVRWEEMFKKLIAFKEEHGHANVSQTDLDNVKLATWVNNQRDAMRLNRPVMNRRKKRLDDIGFCWRLRDVDIWERMFRTLIEYKKLHGHCNVPQRWIEDKALGRWVNTQRMKYRKGAIIRDRINRLEQIGFVWNTKKS